MFQDLLVCDLFGVLHLVFVLRGTQLHVKLLNWMWMEMAVEGRDEGDIAICLWLQASENWL